ncbi:MAG: Uncharacterized protein CEO21_236, partial [Microgenomates group bacterium Gr01-1014_80]
MPVSPSDLLSLQATLLFIKIAILTILILYAIFALLIVRQVDLMSKTLITPVSQVVKAI